MKSTGIMDLINTVSADAIPESVMCYVKEQILDFIGCSMAGIRRRAGQGEITTAKYSSGSVESSIIGDGRKISNGDAFIINAFSDRIGYYKEDRLDLPYHPGRLIISAALTAGEKLNACISDVAVVILLTNELIMQARSTTREIIWPLHMHYPDPELIPYLSLPRIAHIVRELLLSRMHEDQNVITTLLVETLSILQTGIAKSATNSSEKELLLAGYSTSLAELQFAKGTWEQFITSTAGLSPNMKEHFLLINVIALQRAIRVKPMVPEFIKNIVLSIPLWFIHLLKDTGDEDKLIMATAIAFGIFGAQSPQSWEFTNTLDRFVITHIAERIKFIADLDYDLDPEGVQGRVFTARIRNIDDGILTGREACPIMVCRELVEISAKGWLELNTEFFVSEKQSAELYEKLMHSDRTGVKEILKLTYSPACTSVNIEKGLNL